MTKSPCKNFHWIGETLMAEEFGEAVELCSVDWSGLDEFEAEHKRLIAAAPELLEALEQVLIEYDDVDLADHEPKSFTSAVLSARAAIAKARGQS